MSSQPENTGRKQDGTFKKGVSGNPSGKPRGTRHKATQAALYLLEGESEVITRKAVELALGGDVTALRLCLERIVPALKAVSPKMEISSSSNTLTGQAQGFITAAANGDISADTATQMISALANVARIEEFENIKHRLESLERAMKGQAQ
ncbi:MAG: hypothetical protein CBB87_11650 [Micavibrio sp. TMED27]|nr:hypothetical protein [Micavibrio sp.]OUT89624.1 MAG: hypothetical protein CBB87_11650 [Micavibrio sp. TMED27]|tara:strand:- start:78 stop:527 length:450 start_codon:yes stop_codon:yes gene_type:complete